jgi:glycosyltransferase involved in cell wall biosynthesis
MRIAQVAPLYERVPPVLYGGTERVVSYLTEELVRLGHEVTLFASGDSLTRARLDAACPRALRLDTSCEDSIAPHIHMLGEVYRQAYKFDVIHCHTTYLGLPLTPYVATPTILTHHGRMDVPEQKPIFSAYPDVAHISISDAQRQPLPGMNWAATVYHGLPLNLYPFQSQSRGAFLLFLGRISPEKRPDSAIRIACRAGIPLRIAAKVDRVDQAYFDTTIRPLLDHPLVEFLGEVNEEQKRTLLGDALALLFPIDWPEPFGLVMIEALACGTPVIVRRRGSAPEVMQDGVTGFVCETDEEMVAAVQKVKQLDRVACRRVFAERFSVQRMAQDYVTVYKTCLERTSLQRPPLVRRTLPVLPARRQQTRSKLSSPQGGNSLPVSPPLSQSSNVAPLNPVVIPGRKR